MRKLLIGLVAIMIIIIVVGGMLMVNYYKPNIINLEEVDASILEGKNLGSPIDLKSIIEEVEKEKRFPANPRIKVFYQGVEVAYIDHNGNIYGSAGWFTTLNASITNSSVFYQAGSRLALNSSLDIASWIADTDTWDTTNIAFINKTNTFSADQNLGGKNITNVGNISFGGSNNIYDNSTCIKIQGATSLLEIC